MSWCQQVAWSKLLTQESIKEEVAIKKVEGQTHQAVNSTIWKCLIQLSTGFSVLSSQVAMMSIFYHLCWFIRKIDYTVCSWCQFSVMLSHCLWLSHGNLLFSVLYLDCKFLRGETTFFSGFKPLVVMKY